MTPNPELIDGLLRIKEQLGAFYEVLHDQEHLWEVEEWRKLEKWWDKANDAVNDIRHKILKRIYQLGGRPPNVTSDELEAFTAALAGFQSLHAACQALYELTESREGDDYVTQKKLMGTQETIEEWIVESEAKLAQARRLRNTFMGEQM